MAYPKQSFRKLKLTAVAIAALMTSSQLAALGLGPLEVKSNLDQPLNGVIELRVGAGDDLSSVQASIASRDDFEKLGINYPSYLGSIKLLLDSVDGQSVLRVISENTIIKEPFIHFLVRVDWSGGSFLREYTALIDPPVYAAATPKALAQPREVGTDQAYQIDQPSDIVIEEAVSEVEDIAVVDAYEEEIQEPQIEEAQSLQPEIDEADVSQQSSGAEVEFDSSEIYQEQQPSEPSPVSELPTDAQYGPVAAGESLSLIAAELQRQIPDLSIYQVMQVLFEENRGAFIDGNINGLLMGSVLNLGDLDAIRAVDVAQAKQFFYEQVNEWSASSPGADTYASDDTLRVGQDEYNYNDDIYGDTTSSSSGTDTESDASEAFQVGASSDTQAFASTTNGAEREGEVLALQQQVADMEGALQSSSLENQEMAERISLLEGQLADMNNLLSMDVTDADLATLEQGLAAANDATQEGFDDATQLSGELAEQNIASEEILELVDADEIAVTEPDLTESRVAPAADADAVTIYSQPSFMDKAKATLIDSGLWKTLAGLGVLLAGGLGAFMYRRRRADEEFEISMLSIESQSINEASQLAATAASKAAEDDAQESGKSSPEQETSFLTVYSDSDAVVQADEVDPIAEADVYIAYGRDEQAEEVLLDGISAKPARVDIKQKLLALYHKNNNTSGFERVAEELYSQKDQITSDTWQQVCLMGKDIAPNNPLFEVSAADIEVDASLAVNPGTQDLGSTEGDAEKISDEALDDLVNVDGDEGSASEFELDSIAEVNVDVGSAAEVDLDSVVDDDENSININFSDFDLDEKATDKPSEATVENASEVVELALAAEDDDSINLINFDDGRSEISELDDVGFDALAGGSLAFDEADIEGLDISDDEIDFIADDTASTASGAQASTGGQDYDEARTQYELAKVFVDLGDEDGARKILMDIVASQDVSSDVVVDSNKLLESIGS